jgi:hypothetical protein
MSKFKEEIDSIQILPTDHFHFTNDCCRCDKSVDDSHIFPININRRSGLDMRNYIEKDYMCENCLIELRYLS